MTRPRVEGVGRRIGRQVSGSGGSSYTPTRDSRIMIEDSGWEMLSKGLSGAVTSYSAIKTLQNNEKAEEVQKVRNHNNLVTKQAQEKARILARTGRDSSLQAIETYYTENPEALNVPPEKLLAESEDLQNILKANLNEERVPFENILFQAEQEVLNSLNGAYTDRRNKKIKEANISEASKFLETETKRLSGNDDAWPVMLSKTKELFNLSDDEVADTLNRIQENNLSSTSVADDTILRKMLDLDLVPDSHRAKFKIMEATARPLLEQRDKQEKGSLLFYTLPEMMRNGQDIEAIFSDEDNTLGKQLRSHFSANEISSFVGSYKKEQAKQYSLTDALNAWVTGSLPEYNDPTGNFSFTSEKDMMELEGLANTLIYEKDPRYLKAPPEQKAEVLTQLQIEGAKANNRIPIAMSKQIKAALVIPDKVVPSLDEVPNAFKSAFTLATKLEANGMLGIALDNSKDSMAFRAIVHLSNHGEDFLGAYKRVDKAKEDNPQAFSIDYRSVDDVMASLKDEMSGWYTGDKEDYKAAPSAVKAAGRIYNINRGFGMSVEEAKDATLTQMKNDYVPVDGGFLNRNALVGMTNTAIENVTKKVLNDVAELNPQLNREDLYLTEMRHGRYAVTNEEGLLIRTNPTSAQPDSMYTILDSDNFRDFAKKLAEIELDTSTEETISDIKDNQKPKPEIPSQALFPTF